MDRRRCDLAGRTGIPRRNRTGVRCARRQGRHRRRLAPRAKGTNPGTPDGVGAVLAGLVAQARPNADLDGNDDPGRFTAPV